MRRQGLSFSKVEIIDLAKSMLAVGLAFTIMDTGLKLAAWAFYVLLSINLVTVGLGFLLHELAHKVVAQRYGCWSEYRANNGMLLFAILLSFTGFVFAAPGAVMIQGVISKRQNGLISLAGPATNIALSLLFLPLALGSPSSIAGLIGLIGFSINAWLALFNLLPFGNLDGSKVLRWNKSVYALTALAAVLLFLLSFWIPQAI